MGCESNVTSNVEFTSSLHPPAMELVIKRPPAEGFGCTMTEDNRISRVFEGKPAHTAGMLPNDLVVSVNGKQVRGPGALIRVMTQCKAQSLLSITMGVQRGDENESLSNGIDSRKRPMPTTSQDRAAPAAKKTAKKPMLIQKASTAEKPKAAKQPAQNAAEKKQPEVVVISSDSSGEEEEESEADSEDGECGCDAPFVNGECTRCGHYWSKMAKAPDCFCDAPIMNGRCTRCGCTAGSEDESGSED